MANQSKTFYAITQDSEYIHSGYNTTSEKECKADLLALLEPQIERGNFKEYKRMPLFQLTRCLGYVVETSENEFPELPFD